jgi:hypothetical protein
MVASISARPGAMPWKQASICSARAAYWIVERLAAEDK